MKNFVLYTSENSSSKKILVKKIDQIGLIFTSHLVALNYQETHFVELCLGHLVFSSDIFCT